MQPIMQPMRRSSIQTLLVWLALVWGCSSHSNPSDAVKHTRGLAAVTRSEPQAPQTKFYHDDGRLLESNERVAGLVLPQGLKKVRDDKREHVYVSEVPLEKMREYFARRLIASGVERPPVGFAFRNAAPKSARGGIVKLDVVGLTAHGTRYGRVHIYELPPPLAKPLNEAEVRAQLQRDQQRLD